MDIGTESTEKINSKTRAIDVLDPSYRIHWVHIDNLQRMLQLGAYSPKFARRVKDPDYPYRSEMDYDSEEEFVYSTIPGSLWVGRRDRVGIVFSPIKEKEQRVAPRRFLAICVDDHFEKYNSFSVSDATRKNEIKAVIEDTTRVLKFSGVDLGIYGLVSGNMFWPQDIKHNEIVRALAEKKQQ